MDSPEVPEQFGVLLHLDARSVDVPGLVELIAARLETIPRLRQRLLPVPLGCGRPIWVDDDQYRRAAHVRVVACPAPGDDPAVLDSALRIVAEPLARTSPLWAAVLLTGLPADRVALVIVVHHVLADGLGGLRLLGQLVDRPDQQDDRAQGMFPRPWPGRADLVRDAARQRLTGLGRIGRSCRLLASAMAASGGMSPPRAAPCSLNQRTGPRRRLVIIRQDASRLRAAAHRLGGTTNDAVLVAVAAALARVLATRAERIERLSVAVPVSGRRPDAVDPLGNMVAPLLISVPVSGPVAARLADVSAQVRSSRAAATGPPPIALLGGLFRVLAACGGFRWYMAHQRRLHTLVSHVRGPAEPVAVGGRAITAAVGLALGENGNMTVHFEVLSYAGTLAIAAMIDPEHFGEPELLASALREELESITAAAPTSSAPVDADRESG